MEKNRMLIMYILILGVNFSLNVIPLSMASARVPNSFSYVFFLVLNLYLFIWGNSLSFSLAKQKGMYICFTACACVTAIISWYPVYFIYIRNEYGVTLYSIFSTLVSLYLVGVAYVALSTYKHYDEKKNAKVDKWGVPIRSYYNSEFVSEQENECERLGTFIHECVGERHKKRKITVLLFIGVWCAITICVFVCFCYRFTHGVSDFQNLSHDRSIRAECAAKDFVSNDYGFGEAKAFAYPSKYYNSYLTEVDELGVDDIWDVEVYYTRIVNGETIYRKHKLYVELDGQSIEVYYHEDRESFWFLLFKEWPRRFNYEILRFLEKIFFPIINVFVRV